MMPPAWIARFFAITGAYQLLATLMLIMLLPLAAPTHQSAAFVFGNFDTSTLGANNIPDAGYLFILGMLMSQYTVGQSLLQTFRAHTGWEAGSARHGHEQQLATMDRPMWPGAKADACMCSLKFQLSRLKQACCTRTTSGVVKADACACAPKHICFKF